MFSEKLDFLMKVTNTQNSALSRALNFDASYISRIRSGKRGLPKHKMFLEPAAAYFARNLQQPYQKVTVAGVVCPGREWPQDIHEAERLLADWLSYDGLPTQQNPIWNLLTGLSGIAENCPKPPIQTAPAPIPQLQPAISSINLYYGSQGKRDAVLTFLSELCALGTPQTLLLCSDEEMTWLDEDLVFARQWAALLAALISHGSHIKIVHTINRDSNDMMEGLQNWIPLYMSGAVEPYYYPKLRDGVYHRTLFIAQGHSAVISNSVGSHTEGALNQLIHESDAVAALEEEFWDFLALCKPLMQVYTPDCVEAFRQAMPAPDGIPCSHIEASPAPTLQTLPDALAEEFTSQGYGTLAQYAKSAKEHFTRILQEGDSIIEILHLPKPYAVQGGSVCLPLCNMFESSEVHYTTETFRLHLQHCLELLRNEENYHVVLSEEIPANIRISSSENNSCLVANVGTPNVAFAISEPRMTAALWEYLERLTVRKKKSVEIKALETYLTGFA